MVVRAQTEDDDAIPGAIRVAPDSSALGALAAFALGLVLFLDPGPQLRAIWHRSMRHQLPPEPPVKVFRPILIQ